MLELLVVVCCVVVQAVAIMMAADLVRQVRPQVERSRKRHSSKWSIYFAFYSLLGFLFGVYKLAGLIARTVV